MKKKIVPYCQNNKFMKQAQCDLLMPAKPWDQRPLQKTLEAATPPAMTGRPQGGTNIMNDHSLPYTSETCDISSPINDILVSKNE